MDEAVAGAGAEVDQRARGRARGRDEVDEPDEPQLPDVLHQLDDPLDRSDPADPLEPSDPPDPDDPPDPSDPSDPSDPGDPDRVAGLRDGPVPQLVIAPGVDLDRFLPTSVLYVHMSLEQYLRQTRGAARAENIGPLTLEAAIELLHHTRVQIKPVIDLHQHWAVDSYQTPPRMAEHVTLATPVEVFPYGTTPARAADHDHTHPYRTPTAGGPPGQTSTTNLAPLGRHHHRIKTHGPGWIHRQPQPGIHYWRTPHGHWARVDHHGTHSLGHHLGNPLKP